MLEKNRPSFLLAAAFLMFTFALPAFGPSEDEQMRRALERGESAAARSIFLRWMASKDPALWELTEKYLLADPERNFLSGYGQREEIVDSIIKSQNYSLYPAALTAMQAYSGLGRAEARPRRLQTLYEGIIRAIPENEFVRSRMIDGNPDSATQRTSIVSQKVGNEEVKRYKVPADPNGYAVAKALSECGALASRGIAEVFYEKGSSAKIEGSEQFDFQNAPSWILKTRQTQLYPYLMLLRDDLNDKTKPTREELTKLMFAEIETGPPQSSEALKTAVRNRMVRDTPNRYSSSKPATVRVLHVDLNDDSDLKLARMLLRSDLPTKPLTGLPADLAVGLNDVQAIYYFRKGAPDYKAEIADRGRSTVNHAPDTNVRFHDKDFGSLRVADLLAENMYLRDQKEGSIWRTPKLLKISGSYSPSQLWPVGCEGLRDLSKAGTAEMQKAQ
jgi:hypothetical protein